MQALELEGGVQNPNPNQNQNQMALELEALSVSDLLNFIIYDNTTLTAPGPSSIFFPNDSPPDQFNSLPPNPPEFTFTGRGASSDNSGSTMQQRSRRIHLTEPEAAAQGRKKRRRRPKVLKNREEAETQRMTHIAVERNRRKQMNDHLAVLRSLMPESYIQRGDQASIVGGAIEYIKELEHLLQTLEAQKLLSLQGGEVATATTSASSFLSAAAPFAQFFCYPQYTWSELVSNNKCTSKSKQGGSSTVADIEVTLIETHASVRILSKKSFTQISKLVSAFHTLFLSILHLSVTTVDALVLYSISAKVEEGCQLTSADDIAGAVHHVLRIIEEESSLC